LKIVLYYCGVTLVDCVFQQSTASVSAEL